MESGRQKISQPTTIWEMLPICGPRKIISWVSIFPDALTLKYGNTVKGYLKRDRAVISVGRVMTCVLGMIVNREREIRSFTKTPFYRVIGNFKLQEKPFTAEWRAVEGSKYYNSPALYKENGFKKKEDAERLIAELTAEPAGPVTVTGIEKKKENKNAPLLYNLAELQNDCSKYFKISPDETLRIVQELYEKKMTTYPRTDARVLSTAVAKEIHKNIGGLRSYALATPFAKEVLEQGTYKNIAKTRYVNDKQITDHYAIIPTGQGLNNPGRSGPYGGKSVRGHCTSVPEYFLSSGSLSEVLSDSEGKGRKLFCQL